MKLAIGGENRPGWTTLGARVGDVIATIPPLPQSVTSQKWDVIEWIHGPASLYPWQLTELLPQLRDVLAPGGVLVMETPNAVRAAESMVQHIELVRWMFGDPSYKDPLYMNCWAYTPETLSYELRTAGFKEIQIIRAFHHHPGRDFRIEASL
jgi:hypothetical protein